MEIVEVLPSEIKINQRFRKDVGDLTELMESIKLLGLLHPIGITEDKNLVFGQRRLEAWKRLFPEKPIPCVVVDGDFYLLKLMEFHENKKRKEMTWQEEVLALDELKQIYEKLYGWVKERERTDLTVLTVNTVEKYSQEKFAEELGVSQPKISIDLELAEALKTYHEFWKIETKKAAYHRLLAIRKREQVLSTIGEPPC